MNFPPSLTKTLLPIFILTVIFSISPARANTPSHADFSEQVSDLRSRIANQREPLESLESAITQARWTKNTFLGFSIVIGYVLILRSGIDFLGGTLADAYGFTKKSAFLSSFITQGILVSGSSAGAAYYFQLQDRREQQRLLREISHLKGELDLEEDALDLLSE
ncbi:hypothetical protein WDW86_01360 [Bdellovibrionota bacterium FG-2]